MKAHELFSDLSLQSSTIPAEQEISGIAIDSRKCRSGDLFVVRQGLKEDGRRYVPDARAAGAVAFISETEIPGVPVAVVEDTRLALAALSRRFYGEPDRELQVVGITGTNGKTTTAHMVRALLSAHGHCGLIGTVETDDGNSRYPSMLTTPEAHDIYKLLRNMTRHGCSYAAMEASAHGVSLHRTTGLAFRVGVFTNFSVDHLDYYGTMEAYLNAKLTFFEQLDPGATAVLNADDEVARQVEAICPCPIIRFGSESDTDVRLVRTTVVPGGQQLKMKVHGQLYEILLPMAGNYNAWNAMAAVSAVSALGLEPAAGFNALAALRPVPGRLQPVPSGDGIRYFVDFAHTPDGLERVLRSLREETTGRLICVFGCGGDRDRTKRPLMVGAVCRYADLVFATSDNPRTEDPAQIFSDMRAGDTCGREIHWIQDRAEAIRKAVDQACPGDVLVVAGKGHESYQLVGNRKMPFSDTRHLETAIRERNHAD